MLKNKAIYLDLKDHLWRYSINKSLVSKSEFWIPQRDIRPPNKTYYQCTTGKYFLNGTNIWFDKERKHWIGFTPDLAYVPNNYFKGPTWIEGGPEHLPPTSKQSTPKPTVTSNKKGSFCVPSESEMESEPDKETSQEDNPFSDLPKETQIPELSPITGLGLTETESKIEIPSSPRQEYKTPEPKKEPSPKSSSGIEYANIDPDPNPNPFPDPDPDSDPESITMADPLPPPLQNNQRGILGKMPEFAGK